MKPTKHEASEKERALKAVYKRIQRKEIRKYAARKEKATEMRTQQQCILSGGVYLRHRLRKSSFSLEKSEIPEKHIFLKIHIYDKYQRELYHKKTFSYQKPSDFFSRRETPNWQTRRILEACVCWRSGVLACKKLTHNILLSVTNIR